MKPKKSESATYRAVIHIRGITDQTIYGKDLHRLKTRAISKLTAWPPGKLSCYPENIQFYKRLGKNSDKRGDYAWEWLPCWDEFYWRIERFQPGLLAWKNRVQT